MTIRIFNGQWRGAGKAEEAAYVQITFDGLRSMVKTLRGPKLAIFQVLLSHSDPNGVSWPSYDTIARETGYGRAAISRHLSELCRLSIDGCPALIRWRERGPDGRFSGSNRYKVFPTSEEVAVQSSLGPTVVGNQLWSETNCGPGEPEQEPSKALNKNQKDQTVSPVVNDTTGLRPPVSANGTGPAPAKTRTRRKATARTPLQLGQGSTIYRDVVKLTPNEAQRAMLDAAFDKHGARHMVDALERWLARKWSPTNVPGMVDFMDGGDRGRREEAKAEAFWASVQW